ncbi:MAG: DUF262 domain-containing protein, partial [Chloroflexi bacterium]|nr:DUF262 domain-containing protein [Chloroflexota bacterium]
MADEKKLIDIVGCAVAGEYNLSEMQRNFVWKAEQVHNLADSLYHGYPIGMLLLWNNPEYLQPRRGTTDGKRQPPIRWIIDGQQRTTSLCLLFGQTKPHWYGPDEWAKLQDRNKVFMNVDPSDGGVEFRGRRIGSPWKSVSVTEVLNKEEASGVLNLAQQISEGDADIYKGVLNQLINLWNIRNTYMPVITIEFKEPKAIAKIFARFNRGGTLIKETDVRFTIIAANNPGWVRGEFDPFLERLRNKGWNIPSGYLLQAMTVFHLGKARMSEVRFEDPFWSSGIRDIWGRFKDAVDEVITLLWDRGISKIDLIPSKYALIPLFAIHRKFKNSPSYSFDDVYRWFLGANFEGRYSRAPLETLTKDTASIYGSSTIEEVLGKMPLDRVPSLENLMSLFQEPFRKGSFGGLLIHLLLWKGRSHDWIEPLSIIAATTSKGVFEPHWHHILPRTWAQRNSFGGADKVANMTILTEATNVRKLRRRPPWDYVSRYSISQQALEEHFVPKKFAGKFVSGTSLSSEEFQDFVRKRAKLLAEETMKYLGLP